MVYRLILLSLLYLSMKQKEYFHFEFILTLHISTDFFYCQAFSSYFYVNGICHFKKLIVLGGDTKNKLIVFLLIF